MIRIDKARLWKALEALGDVGAYTDEPTGLRGVNRLALTAADGAGRRHVVERMREAGLTVKVDQIGNVYGRREGKDPRKKPVLSGSHIDSVPTGGRFDGCLGVLGALEVIRTLDEKKIATHRPIVAAFFTDEEGARFGTDMLGSAVATGRLDLETAYALTDRAGMKLKDELEKVGFLGTADVNLDPPHAYVECHVEQGPILRARNQDIGVVTGVQAISWHELTITGKSSHAGTTPMDMRADAGVAAARINLKMREMIASGNYGKEMRATMGGVNPHPGLVNIVPGRCACTVDLRNPDDAFMKAAERDLIAYYDVVSKEEKVEISWRQTARTEFVPFAPEVQEQIARFATDFSLKHERIISGAGHDAQEMARVCKAGMVFVPGEYDGISHNPREWSTAEQCENGVNVLANVLLHFANEEAGP